MPLWRLYQPSYVILVHNNSAGYHAVLSTCVSGSFSFFRSLSLDPIYFSIYVVVVNIITCEKFTFRLSKIVISACKYCARLALKYAFISPLPFHNIDNIIHNEITFDFIIIKFSSQRILFVYSREYLNSRCSSHDCDPISVRNTRHFEQFSLSVQPRFGLCKCKPIPQQY